MPGHVKLGKSGEPDPDPAPYLVISMDMKRADMLKPYDPKKSYWGPDGTGGFKEGILEADDGTKATMMMGHEVIHSFLSKCYTCKCNYHDDSISEKSLQVFRSWTS